MSYKNSSKLDIESKQVFDPEKSVSMHALTTKYHS